MRDDVTFIGASLTGSKFKELASTFSGTANDHNSNNHGNGHTTKGNNTNGNKTKLKSAFKEEL